MLDNEIIGIYVLDNQVTQGDTVTVQRDCVSKGKCQHVSFGYPGNATGL